MNNINQLNLTIEMKALLFFLKKHVETENWGRTVEIDWPLFIELAQHHRVYPSIYTKLKTVSWVPDWVKETFRVLVQRNTMKMLFLTSESEKLSQIFESLAIRSLFLKGPALAYDLYGDLSLRTSSDLDILIPMDELKKVESLLTSEGYVKDDYIQSVLNDWKWRHHHFTYFHPGKKIKVEIHWRLHPGPASEPNFEKLWARRRTIKLATTPVFILGKEDLFLFLVSHGARHGWSRLRWLVDIQLLCEHSLDWGMMRKRLKQHHYLHIAEQALLLVEKLLDGGVKVRNRKRACHLAQMAMYYMEHKVNLHDEKVPEDVAEYHKHYLFALMSWQQKCLFILSFLYPYPMDKETLPLPEFLHFLYFPLRPFLMAWRKTRKQAVPQGD